ncbi:MAG TPA: helix-turn-helix domain-containing protein [Streptosporangiaceae bacterium]|jgi:excisionase family DNA binding protein|nr:helix-turn-helix domain-containing protein [Streptosporangiaceae bacterium]
MAADAAAPEHAAGGTPDGLLLTVEEAAHRLRIGRTLVYQLISSGELESVKVGRLRRVPAECLPEYVATLRRTRSSKASDSSAA